MKMLVIVSMVWPEEYVSSIHPQSQREVRPLGVVVVGALAAAVTLMLVHVGLALAFSPITASLASVSSSGVAGTATLSGTDNAATMTVDLSGLSPGTTYRVLLQAGTCAAPSASAGLLGTFPADASGRGRLTSGSVRATATGATIPLTLSLLADGDHIIAVAGPSTVACGALPRAIGTLPTTGGTSPMGAIRVGLLLVGVGFALRRKWPAR